nr:hypothetical protein Iba_chr05bCG9130 [Ipomoea batatas]GMC98230.1 hypothetical protein Iba_chr05dCG14600 [Ipomoea batatas]GMC98231.1 hypothetical protein Iba_chr05dCG14610 [Ipomoea batatas]
MGNNLIISIIELVPLLSSVLKASISCSQGDKDLFQLCFKFISLFLQCSNLSCYFLLYFTDFTGLGNTKS